MFEKIKEMVAENLGVDAGSITEESSFKDDPVSYAHLRAHETY